MIEYFKLFKPWITFSNLISVVSGFFLASRLNINYIKLLYTIVGVFLIMSSSCLCNNYIDRNVDKKMKRTKNRILAKKKISIINILLIINLFLIIGCIIIYKKCNLLVLYLNIIGFVVYVFLYSLLLKQKSFISTIVGSISGAMPPVIGYCSSSNKFDFNALILVLVFVIWQIPHFYSIALMYIKEYKLASIPLFPIIFGYSITRLNIILFIIFYIIISTYFLFINHIKLLIVNFIISNLWLFLSIKKDIKIKKRYIWAKNLFILSILTITIFNIIIIINNFF